MDISELNGEYESKPIFSFLACAWAIIADCDINSELIRCIGEARFTIWGVWRVLALKRYRGSFDFNGFKLQNKNDFEHNGELEGVTQPLIDNKYENQTFLHFLALNTPWLGSSYFTAPCSKMDDGLNDIILMTTEQGGGRTSLARVLIDQDNGNYFT